MSHKPLLLVKDEYVFKKVASYKSGNRKCIYRNWFLVKFSATTVSSPSISLPKDLYFPIEYAGKKIKLKIEVVENEDTK